MAIEVDAKRPAEDVDTHVDGAPAEKKARVCNFEALKKQVEYYLSDANLKNDKFFHTKISENADGWLALTNILACNKIKALTSDANEIIEAIASSTNVEANDAGDSIRRKSPLPTFEGELRRNPKANNEKNPAVKKQVKLGEFKFPNLASAKKRVGEILKSRRAGVIFKDGTPDYNLVLAVMNEHPNAASKMEGMTGIKVDAAPVGESRCFYIVKGENKDQFEDISIVKAFNNFESKLIAAAESQTAESKPEEEKPSEETPVEETEGSNPEEKKEEDVTTVSEDKNEETSSA